jgi:hypothetical protein
MLSAGPSAMTAAAFNPLQSACLLRRSKAVSGAKFGLGRGG